MKRAALMIVLVVFVIVYWRMGTWLEDQGLLVRCITCAGRLDR